MEIIESKQQNAKKDIIFVLNCIENVLYNLNIKRVGISFAESYLSYLSIVAFIQYTSRVSIKDSKDQ